MCWIPFLAQFLHHGGGGAEIEQRLVVGRLEQFPEEGFKHPHAVVLEIFGQVGVVTRHQRNRFCFGQPDAAQAQHRRIHHMDQVRLEAVDRFGDGGSRKRQLEFGIERQWHRRNADQASSHVFLWASLRTNTITSSPASTRCFTVLVRRVTIPSTLGRKVSVKKAIFKGVP